MEEERPKFKFCQNVQKRLISKQAHWQSRPYKIAITQIRKSPAPEILATVLALAAALIPKLKTKIELWNKAAST